MGDNIGYRLPLQHEAYQNYHQRIISKQVKPFYVEKPYKIILANKQREEDNYQRESNLKDWQIQAIYSRITGKGKHFDEQI